MCTPALAMTPAGTVISDVATLTDDSGSVSSNSVDVVVLQVGGCQVTPTSGAQSGVAGGVVYLPVVVTDAGNGSDAFSLSTTSTAGWPVLIYRDDNGDGLHQAGETTVLTSTGPLAMGGQAACILAVTLPAGLAGSESLTLTAVSGYDTQCLGTAAFVVSSVVPVSANFSASPTSGSAPLKVAFTDTSSGSPTAWSWSFGDGATSTVQNPSHTYSAAGTYTVALTASNAGGPNTKTIAGCVSVSVAPPATNFSASPTSGTAPLTVAFTDKSSGSPTAWSWSFGDGGTSTVQNPSHTYSAAGTYTVALIASNAGGPNTKTIAGCISVTVAPPAADFSASPTSGPAPLNVQFTDPSSGTPTSWLWNFGDGSTSTQQNPSHVYGSPGSYTVSLTASNSAGQGTVTKSGCISVTAGTLVANFSASPRTGKPPLTVSFTDQSSGKPTGWAWIFGDGSGSTQQNPIHNYALPGLYSVTLVVTNGSTTSTKGWSRCVTVLKARSAGALFVDMPPDYWAYTGVMACYDVDLVAGYPDDTYRPALSVSRDQMAVYVSRALAGNDQNVPEGPAEASFADVPSDYWAYRYIEYAKDQQIALGFPDGLFHPAEAVNRGQMAVFVARLIAEPAGEAGLAGYVPPQTSRFSDVGLSGAWSWCYKYVEYIAEKGVTSGYSDGTYHPEVTCTRDQMAEFLARGLGLE